MCERIRSALSGLPQVFLYLYINSHTSNKLRKDKELCFVLTFKFEFRLHQLKKKELSISVSVKTFKRPFKINSIFYSINSIHLHFILLDKRKMENCNEIMENTEVVTKICVNCILS